MAVLSGPCFMRSGEGVELMAALIGHWLIDFESSSDNL